MSILEFIILYLPLVLIVLFSFIIIGLRTLYNKTKNWRFKSLQEIPISFILLYGWIFIFNPDTEITRTVSRMVILFGCGNSLHAIYSYIANLKKNVAV